ncbi:MULTISPECIES: fused response regulator/phosphatase [Kitasatospora]|uniref:Putative response regulator n=1 Tax=Kitasatospora setae (strain ATCC 33774 / DSM 43861 / JCM 3304 / KCC A-0304 / NBRC 14216 / KM-6054) TaxID=452652 RepID=E4N584_KITSK|nr:fused response regulator/phosphatase [Kitasatospora setae]BAJ26365.1 putative response regulator [Kitasatospora setae KM-6054]
MTPTSPDAGPATVLVLDDNDTTRYVVGSWLRRSGHTVVEAVDGAQALALLERSPATELPELAVVDISLPDMTGFEVCERIKGAPRTAALPVVHISATAIEASDRTQGLHRGADAYLTEPIDPAELQATVTAVLRYTRARRRAERLAARVAALHRSTLALYGATDPDALAGSAALGAVRLGAARATAIALGPDRDTLHLAHHDPGLPDGPEVRLFEAPPVLLDLLAHHTLGDATGAGTALLDAEAWSAVLADHGLAGTGLPTGPVAVVTARTKPGRPPLAVVVDGDALAAPDERDLLPQLTQAAALALEAQRSQAEEHALALTLQRSFLPGRLPAVPGVELAVRYEPASARSEIGGDFYEAIDTPDGLLLAIGDVAGHSLEAAMAMGELRHALRAYAIEGHDPQTLLHRLDTLLTRLRPGLTATVCLVLIAPDRRSVRIANAGHLPPLLRLPDGSARYLSEHGILLGLNVPQPPTTEYPVPPGSTLLLVTDGLIEVPGEHLQTGLDTLRDAFADAPPELDRAGDLLLSAFARAQTDDIALLIARLD